MTTVAVRERGILFSGAMVRAILDGRKTQTRRVVKPQAWSYSNDALGQPVIYPRSGPHEFGDPSRPINCPFGPPGTRLWVRETWSEVGDLLGWSKPGGARPSGHGAIAYQADGEIRQHSFLLKDPEGFRVSDMHRSAEVRWKPSIHMPRWASRLTLEVTGVRVERLQEITADGVIAEGFVSGDAFAKGWDALNAKRGHLWASNPWVWAIEFRRLSGSEVQRG